MVFLPHEEYFIGSDPGPSKVSWLWYLTIVSDEYPGPTEDTFHLNLKYIRSGIGPSPHSFSARNCLNFVIGKHSLASMNFRTNKVKLLDVINDFPEAVQTGIVS